MARMAKVAVLVLAVLVAQPVAADFEAGQRAWDAGNVEEAVGQWRSAADAGDRRAMLALGLLYVQGLGVLQDYVEAHKWLNLAASRGEAAALKERDAVAAKMTPEERAEAQKLARAWRSGGGGAGVPSAASEAPVAAAAPVADAGPPPPRAIREAQALLGALGYRPGPADGIWGRRTGAAYEAFLRDVDLPAAERLTPEALRAMRVMAKRRGVGGTTASAGAAAPSSASAPRPAARPDALHRAAQAGDVDGLKAALAAGVDINARDGRGWTALMHAVNKGYTLLVEPLLAAKAGLDVRAPDGATALFMAAVHGHADIIVMLMKAGADVSVRGPKGKTAVDVAFVRDDAALLGALGIPREGDVFRDCPMCPELVVVPAGSFMMGSPSGEEYRDDDEDPVHRVTIGKAFAVGVYEVTFDEWDACVRGGGCDGYRRNDRGWGRGNRPVIYVSWEDAQGYVEWLSEKTGKGYRLLSESEWEYVTRARTTTAFHFGRTISTEQANYDGDSTYGSGPKGVYREKTLPVGSFPANEFGLHDLHGNVWEWVEDCWNGSYQRAPSDGSAWTSGDCSLRVLRGGSWDSGPWALRSANRSKYTTVSGASTGFRIARTLTP